MKRFLGLLLLFLNFSFEMYSASMGSYVGDETKVVGGWISDDLEAIKGRGVFFVYSQDADKIKVPEDQIVKFPAISVFYTQEGGDSEPVEFWIDARVFSKDVWNFLKLYLTNYNMAKASLQKLSIEHQLQVLNLFEYLQLSFQDNLDQELIQIIGNRLCEQGPAKLLEAIKFLGTKIPIVSGLLDEFNWPGEWMVGLSSDQRLLWIKFSDKTVGVYTFMMNGRLKPEAGVAKDGQKILQFTKVKDVQWDRNRLQIKYLSDEARLSNYHEIATSEGAKNAWLKAIRNKAWDQEITYKLSPLPHHVDGKWLAEEDLPTDVQSFGQQAGWAREYRGQGHWDVFVPSDKHAVLENAERILGVGVDLKGRIWIKNQHQVVFVYQIPKMVSELLEPVEIDLSSIESDQIKWMDLQAAGKHVINGVSAMVQKLSDLRQQLFLIWLLKENQSARFRAYLARGCVGCSAPVDFSDNLVLIGIWKTLPVTVQEYLVKQAIVKDPVSS